MTDGSHSEKAKPSQQQSQVQPVHAKHPHEQNSPLLSLPSPAPRRVWHADFPQRGSGQRGSAARGVAEPQGGGKALQGGASALCKAKKQAGAAGSSPRLTRETTASATQHRSSANSHTDSQNKLPGVGVGARVVAATRQASATSAQNAAKAWRSAGLLFAIVTNVSNYAKWSNFELLSVQVQFRFHFWRMNAHERQK